MGLSIPIPVKSNGDGEPVDWKLAKQEVIARLDIRKEYEALGVKIAGSTANEKGFVPCYALDRPSDNPDTRPSAAINVRKGFYLDKGMSGQSISFFQFAVDHGRFGSFIEAFRYYADKVGVEIGKIRRNHKGAIVEAAYEYAEADGELKYRVLRLLQPNGKKDFSQEMWDGDRWVGGRGCMEGVAPLPYRLPELMASTDEDVCLVLEGEKDVDRAFEAGFVATTNHTGAHNWNTTGALFLHRLPARDYVVIPDNDDVGRKHAATVAEALHDRLAGFGPSWLVKVVTLPDLPHKGDLSDWFDLGGTPEDLRALIAAAPEWQPGQAVEEPTPKDDDPDDPEGDCTIEDLARHVSDCAWAWEGWIPSSALTLLASEAGAGKTRLMMDLHRRAHCGLDWPDGRPMNLPLGGKVVWIVADNHHEQMVLEAKAFGLFGVGAIVINTKRKEPFGGTTLVTDEDLAGLEARIRRNKPYWVVIDTITNTGDYKIQDAVDAKRQYKPLQEIAQRTKTPIICVTHTNASGKVLGRRAIEKVRVVILFSEPDRDGQPDRRKLWVEKSFAQKPPARGVTVSPGAYEYDDNPPEEPDRESSPSSSKREPKKEEAAIKWIEDCLANGRRRVTDVKNESSRSGISDGTFWRARTAAKERGFIREYDFDGNQWMELEVPELKPYPTASKNGSA